MGNQYPINFDALGKGQLVTAEEVVHAKGIAVGDPHYRFALRTLKCEIEKNRPDLVVKIEGDGIAVLLDEQCSPYLTGQMRYGVRLIARMHARRARVDPSGLTPVQRLTFESESRVSAGVMIAAQQALQRQMRLERLGGHAPALLPEKAADSGD